MPAKRNRKRPPKKGGATNVPTQSGNSYSNPSMDQHVELVQDVVLVSTGGNPGVHDYALQAGVNELIITDPLSGTTSLQYGSVGDKFQQLAYWWVTYTIVSVQVTVQLYNITSGVINSPFLAATEAAELDTQVPTTYQEFAQTGRLTVSNSLTGTVSRSQNFQKYVRENLPRPYLNTMSSNNSTRETYTTVYGATPVIQIAWQSQISSFSTDFEIPKFVAVVTTNTKYHFRGRRTFYPSPQLVYPLDVKSESYTGRAIKVQKAGDVILPEKVEEQPVVQTMVSSEKRIESLKQQILMLESMLESSKKPM